MPSIAANNTAVKTEKVPALDLPESFRSANTVIEKKCRNLEKRKIKLDGYREELARGRTLSEEQQLAAARYNEVVANLELTREFITAFDKIGSETSKEEKKKKKKEIFERQQLELARFKEVFMIQEVFQCLCSPSAREDFVNGFHGAPQLSESDLQKLDTFYSLVSIDRQNLPGGFNEVVTNSATHYQHLLEGRNKEVAGSTYKEIKCLVQTIINNGYFDWKAQPEVVEPETKEPEVVEPVQELPTHLEPVYHSLPDEPTYVESGMEYIEPQAPLPIQPQVVPQATAYFPVDIDTDFNFIQESMIDTKPILSNIPASVPMPVHSAAPVPASLASMDSAVVMVHSQMPHLAYPHFAAAPMYAAHGAPLVPGPPSMQVPTSTQHHQPPPQQLHQQQQQQLPSNDLSGDSIGPDSSAALTSQVETQDNRATASSPWAEEPQDDIPTFQQDQSRNTESNTWTNSNYRSNDQDGRRGGYRGRGNGGPRGSRGGSGGGGSGYYSSRGGYGGGDRQGNGERTYQNSDRHQGNGGDRNGMDRGSYNQSGDRSYQSNNGGGRYQGNNGERNYQGGSYNRSSGDRGGSSYVPRGGYRGGPPRGAPRGSSSRGGGYERNPSYAKE